jgi:Holliday junction resolvase
VRAANRNFEEFCARLISEASNYNRVMMRMNTKAKGSRNERRSIAILESVGYRCSRSAASLGAWDVIGIGPADVVLVQVKTNTWPDREEMEKLHTFPAPANTRKLVHRYIDGKKLPDVREVAA